MQEGSPPMWIEMQTAATGIDLCCAQIQGRQSVHQMDYRCSGMGMNNQT
jgi:hypothetical protein